MRRVRLSLHTKLDTPGARCAWLPRTVTVRHKSMMLLSVFLFLVIPYSFKHTITIGSLLAYLAICARDKRPGNNAHADTVGR